jgi:hypothetical protein
MFVDLSTLSLVWRRNVRNERRNFGVNTVVRQPGSKQKENLSVAVVPKG